VGVSTGGTLLGAGVPAARRPGGAGVAAAEEAERVIAAVLADLADPAHRGVVVDSPPGAGKSTLVVRAARELAGTGEPTMIIAQTNEQVDDLIERLGQAAPELAVGRLSGAEYRPSDRVAAHPAVTVGTKVGDLTGCPLVLGTAAKWATVTDGRWPWAIVDEAYQMRSDMLLRTAGRFERALFVGDPGQLDPFSAVEVDRWTGLAWDPMRSAVAVLLRHNPDLPVHRLPVSWRLPPSAAPLVADAFYPYTGFRAGTVPGQRRLEVPGSGRDDAVDEALRVAASGGWALYELPGRFVPRTDSQAVTATAAIAARALAGEAVARCERVPGGAPLSAERIAIGTAHRDQAAAVRSALWRYGPAAAGITVDTANRLQGREYDLTVMLHPLSGRRDATAFHLESGRLCVLASRHRHGCVVVARAGIADLLDAHPSAEPVSLNVPVRFPDGWEAHQAVLAHLEAHRVDAG
jgi:hypothetical protein